MPSRKWIVAAITVVLALIFLASLDQGTRWDGVDVAVVGQYGTLLGREPWQPLINLQGDALLFAFTAAGTIGGFVAGYYWRELFGSNESAASSEGNAVSGKGARQDV